MTILIPTVVVFMWEEENVVLYFSANSGVAPNDVGQRRPFQFFDLIMRKDAAVKKSISIPQPFKLIDQNGIDEFSDHRAWEVIFGHPADPQVH
jgi:hypothetical protein